jgi:hypothetical protein
LRSGSRRRVREKDVLAGEAIFKIGSKKIAASA